MILCAGFETIKNHCKKLCEWEKDSHYWQVYSAEKKSAWNVVNNITMNVMCGDGREEEIRTTTTTNKIEPKRSDTISGFLQNGKHTLYSKETIVIY